MNPEQKAVTEALIEVRRAYEAQFERYEADGITLERLRLASKLLESVQDLVYPLVKHEVRVEYDNGQREYLIPDHKHMKGTDIFSNYLCDQCGCVLELGEGSINTEGMLVCSDHK